LAQLKAERAELETRLQKLEGAVDGKTYDK
jgi:hypothetical protein